MAPFGLVDTGTTASPPPTPAPPKLRLRVEDALASDRRLWVRGRVFGLDQATGQETEAGWWRWWWGKKFARSANPQAALETQVSGCVLQATVPLDADGGFEAVFEVNLPPCRRGWRLARNRLTVGAETLEGCGIVSAPAEGTAAAVVVILPLACSSSRQGPQELAHSEEAARLTPVLKRLQQQAHGRLPVYYLAGSAEPDPSREAELALAATSLGWPAGNFVVVSSASTGVEAGLAHTLDRLRWLLAGTSDLLVINLEPAARAWVVGQCQPQEDRAAVRRCVQPDESPWSLVDAPPPTPAWVHRPAPRPTRASRVTRYPIVFCHGMLAFTTLRMQRPACLNYYSPMREFLAQRGFRVLYPQVCATGGVQTRAAQLREQIRAWTDEPVNLIAHSMGGLDARYLITHLGMADRVRSLTTVSTPHRGTYLADWFTANFRQGIPLLVALEALGLNVDGFRDCRLEACREFNAATPDMPGVRYFSYGGEVTPARLSPLLRRSWNIVTPVEGPNDGMVSVASARWGEYLGTLHADHFAQTPDMLYLRPGEDFDPLGFCSRLVEDLARRGF